MTQDRVVEVMVDKVVERYVEVSVCALLQHVCIHLYLHMHMCTQFGRHMHRQARPVCSAYAAL